MDEPEKIWLESVGVSIERDPEHDAAGINDDWPTGRGVFIHDLKEFVVLVNFEDHVEIVILPQQPKDSQRVTERDSVVQGLERLLKLISTFDKLGYSADPYLGNLTVSPKNIGTSLVLQADLKLQECLVSQIDRRVLDDMEKLRHQSVASMGDRDLRIVTRQTLAPNYNETSQILDFLDSIAEVATQDKERPGGTQTPLSNVAQASVQPRLQSAKQREEVKSPKANPRQVVSPKATVKSPKGS